MLPAVKEPYTQGYGMVPSRTGELAQGRLEMDFPLHPRTRTKKRPSKIAPQHDCKIVQTRQLVSLIPSKIALTGPMPSLFSFAYGVIIE